MTSLIVDASVAVKWLAAEPLQAEARALADLDDQLMAPDIVVAEVGNALWKRCRRGEISTRGAIRAVDALPNAFDRLFPSRPLSAEAMRLSIALDHPIYDCFYLALAQQIDAPIITADRRLLSVAGRLPHLEIRPLAA
jgi:predicted nucleic acid-binding protein